MSQPAASCNCGVDGRDSDRPRGALRPPPRAAAAVPRPPHRRPADRARPLGRDVRARGERAPALSRRHRRGGGGLAVRDRPAPARALRPPRARRAAGAGPPQARAAARRPRAAERDRAPRRPRRAARRLAAALAQLSPGVRDAVRLRVVDEQPYRRIPLTPRTARLLRITTAPNTKATFDTKQRQRARERAWRAKCRRSKAGTALVCPAPPEIGGTRTRSSRPRDRTP